MGGGIRMKEGGGRGDENEMCIYFNSSRSPRSSGQLIILINYNILLY